MRVRLGRMGDRSKPINEFCQPPVGATHRSLLSLKSLLLKRMGCWEELRLFSSRELCQRVWCFGLLPVVSFSRGMTNRTTESSPYRTLYKGQFRHNHSLLSRTVAVDAHNSYAIQVRIPRLDLLPTSRVRAASPELSDREQQNQPTLALFRDFSMFISPGTWYTL